MKQLDPKNSEVTKEGIKARGSPVGGQKAVTKNGIPLGLLKKRILYLTSTAMAVVIGVGLAVDWTPGMEHVAYPMAFTYLFNVLTIKFLDKVE